MKINITLIESSNIYSIIPMLNILNPNVNDDTLKKRLDEMISQGYRCVGVFDDDYLIGISGLWILTKYYVGKHIEPDNIIIHPDYRNQGIGKILMKWIYSYALQEGCVASELNCYVGNTKAHEFWENEGYIVIAKHFQKKLS